MPEPAAHGSENPRAASLRLDNENLPTVQRLKKRSDFLACRKGRRAHGTGFTMQLLRRAEEGPFRVGFTVTKKIGNAVMRNRIKRRLREAVRLGKFPPEAAGCDCVLLAKPEAEDQNFAALTKEIERGVVHALKARKKTRWPSSPTQGQGPDAEG
ncbi:MAG: ribonuclease P protein component [Pseudomonadota bacterium]